MSAWAVRLTRFKRSRLSVSLLILAMPVAFVYVYLSFTHPSPIVRIALRSLPFLPLAVWTLWFDGQRPFEGYSRPWRLGARVITLLGLMAVTVGVLGVALNWLYDPTRAL